MKQGGCEVPCVLKNGFRRHSVLGVKFVETESRMVVARGWETGVGS